MKIKKVVGIGCSFTRHAIEGEEPQRLSFNSTLLEEFKLSYISHLASLIGCSFENLSQGGIGNRHILRKLYSHIKSNTDISNTLYVIGVSFISRYDFINPHSRDGKFTLPLYSDLKKNYLEDRAKLFKMPLEDILNLSRIFYRYIYNDNTAIEELNELITLYRSLVELKGGNIIFVDMVNGDPRIEGVFTLPNNARSWREFITSYDETYLGKHPNHDDHTRLGELLYTYISENFAKKFPQG